MINKRRPREFLISDPQQLEAIVSPVRNQVRLIMEALGECTVSEVAYHMGRTPESLYYHMRELQNVGLVAQSGCRKANRRQEAVYALCARHLRVDTDQQAPRFLRALARGVKTLFRFAERNWSRALNSGSVVKGGPRSDLRIQQMTVRLRGESIRDINRRIDELTRFLDEADDDSSRAFYVVTVAISPVMETSVKA